MENIRKIPAAPGMFRNQLAPTGAVFLALGALLGLGSLLCLAAPGYLTAVTDKLLISGIRSRSALRVWTAVHILVSAVCCVCPAVVVRSLILVFRGQPARGMNQLSGAVHGLHILLRIAGWALVGIFCLRFALYVQSILHRQDWPYQLMATALMEAMVLSLAVFAYRFLLRFLDEAEGCAVSIGYTLSSHILDPGSIPAFVSGGLTALGILGLILTADRLVTMTVASDGFRQYYDFVWSAHPGQWLCAGSLFFGAIGNLLLALYLRFYKRTSERAVFYATFQK